MAKKEKGLIGQMAPIAIACLFLGAGLTWLIVGLVISIASSFDPNVFNPLYWFFAGGLFLIGLVVLVINSRNSKK